MAADEQELRHALPQGAALREYTIEDVLGHGGFGIVYRARHNELGNQVAIKEYLPVELAVREGASVHPRSAACQADYEDGLRRFRDEARALIEFQSHPSIVSCREFFRANGTAYLVMEHEEGLPLSELLRRREASGRPFDEADLLAVMVPLLEGLERIHEAGMLHRDIKPSNILVRRSDERPVLIDFGAAKQAAAERSKSLAPYTEGYAAWEQVGEGKLGPWTDVYAAGAVMWRMVAGGNPPWAPPHPVKVEKRANAVMRGEADPMPSARELGAGRFSPGLLEAIDRCLKLNEKERVRGCGELPALLRGAGAMEQTPAATVSGGAPQTRSRTRFCSTCGAEITERIQYCPHCGAKANAAEPERFRRGSEERSSMPNHRPDAQYAGFGNRAGALLLDGLILAALVSISGGVFGFVAGIAYFPLLTSSKWQATLGKKAFGIIVTDKNGERISFLRAVGRCFAPWIFALLLLLIAALTIETRTTFGMIAASISMLLLLIGYLMQPFTARKQALHDILCGTLVVKGR